MSSGTLTAGTLILTASQYNGDGFGRIRVSNPSTLYEIYQIYDLVPDKIQQVTSGTGSAEFVGNLSYANMSVSANGDKVVRQSKEYIVYQPGKSKLIFLSGVLSPNTLSTGVTTRIGHFDSSVEKTSETNPIGNGHFFEMVGGSPPVVNVVERSFYNQSLGWGYENRVAQADWNVDPLNGTGPSGITINFNDVNVFTIDLQWLGVGQVRMGIFYNNQIYYCHKFNVTNRNNTFNYNGSTYNLDETPYIQYGKLPVRFEISSTANTSASMRMICATALSEGGYIPIGSQYSFSNFTTSLNASETADYGVVFALRLDSANPRVTTKLVSWSLFFSGSNDRFYWQLLLNPTITGTSLSYSTITGSHTQIATGTNSGGSPGTFASDGTIIGSGVVNSTLTTSFNVSLDNLSLLPTIMASISGTPDILVLCCRRAGTSGTSTLTSCGTILELT